MSSLGIALLTISFAECLLSFYLNTFIALKTGRSLRDGATRSPANLLQFIIGVTNISMRGLLAIDGVIYRVQDIYMWDVYDYTVTFLLISQMCFSYWLMAWLSAHYCTTITTTRHRLFIWIRKALSTFLPHVLVLTATGSLVVALAETGNLTKLFQKGECNATGMEDGAVPPVTLNKISSDILSSCLPCVLISLLVKVSSLLKHVWNMNRGVSGSAHLNVQVHVNAARTMVLFLLLAITFFTSEVIFFMLPYSTDNPTSFVFWTVMELLASAEATIIIQASHKLRKMFLMRTCARSQGRTQNRVE
ncbi:taste receptor type 2 member 4-like [Gastrophryne carolinensis]